MQPAPEFLNQAAYRKRFQVLVNPCLPVFVLNAQGTILYLNLPARGKMELGRDQAILPNFFAYVHQRNLYRVMRDMAEMVCHGKKEAFWLLRLRTGKDRWRWFKATAKNLLAEPDGVLLVFLQDL